MRSCPGIPEIGTLKSTKNNFITWVLIIVPVLHANMELAKILMAVIFAIANLVGKEKPVAMISTNAFTLAHRNGHKTADQFDGLSVDGPSKDLSL